MFDNLQFLEQDETGRIGRRFEHGVAAVVDRDRLLFLGGEGREIVRPDQSTGGGETGGHSAREAAAVKGFRAVCGNFFERAGEIRLHDRGPQGRAASRRRETGRWCGFDQQGRAVLVGEMAIRSGGAKPVAGKGDRLGEQIAPRQPAKAAMHPVERRQHPRHRNRQRAGARNAAGITLRRRCGGRRTGAVEHD